MLFNIFYNRSKNYLYDYATSKSKQLSSIIINESIKKTIDYDLNSIPIINKNNEEEIINISFNTNKVNELLYTITNDLNTNINKIKEGKISTINIDNNLIYYVPIGIIYNNPLLTYIGPKIPFKINYLSSIESNIETIVKEYGINNSLIEIYINIIMNIQVIFPFRIQSIETNKNILLSSNIIQGKIPTYYGGIITNTSPNYSN